jgi:hypothetical protein
MPTLQHGPPSDINSHPHTSGPAAEFVVVHNGIISNYAQLKAFLVRPGGGGGGGLGGGAGLGCCQHYVLHVS